MYFLHVFFRFFLIDQKWHAFMLLQMIYISNKCSLFLTLYLSSNPEKKNFPQKH